MFLSRHYLINPGGSNPIFEAVYSTALTNLIPFVGQKSSERRIFSIDSLQDPWNQMILCCVVQILCKYERVYKLTKSKLSPNIKSLESVSYERVYKCCKQVVQVQIKVFRVRIV